MKFDLIFFLVFGIDIASTTDRAVITCGSLLKPDSSCPPILPCLNSTCPRPLPCQIPCSPSSPCLPVPLPRPSPLATPSLQIIPPAFLTSTSVPLLPSTIVQPSATSPHALEMTAPPNATTEPPGNINVPLIVIPGGDWDYESNAYSCSLSRLNIPICSCVIISNTFSLSPCDKCFRSKAEVYLAEDYQLLHGYFNERQVGHVMELISNPVRRLFRHPECYNVYNNYAPDYDIAVIQTKEKISLSAIHFARLPNNYKFTIDNSRYLYLSNFNVFNQLATHRSDSVWTVLTKIVDGRFCMSMVGNYGLKNICTAYQHPGTYSENCSTDIGSSLAVKREFGEEFVIGLLINKRTCKTPRGVASFVRVAHHVRWIRQLVHKYSYGKELV